VVSFLHALWQTQIARFSSRATEIVMALSEQSFLATLDTMINCAANEAFTHTVGPHALPIGITFVLRSTPRCRAQTLTPGLTLRT